MTTYLPDNVWIELYTVVDGLPTWTNIGADVAGSIRVNLGFTDGDQLSRLAPGGDMRFDLYNSDGAYDPSSTFYKGQKIRLRIKYGSLVKTKFFGYIDHIGLDVGTWGAQQAHVVCIDWLSLAAITPIRSLVGLSNVTIGTAITALLTQMQIQPEALDIETGDITLPSVFDQVTINSTVYSELQNLVMGEWGYIYMRDGGMTLKVENSLSRTGDGSDYKTTTYYNPDGVETDFLLEDGTNFLLEDNTNFLLEGEPTSGSFDSDFGETYTNLEINHGDNLVNQINASAVPVVIGGSTLTLYTFNIASGSKAVLVPTNSASSPYVLQGQYKDPTAGGSQISANSVVTPVLSTDWTFNSKSDGTGTDLSANITITFTNGQTGFKALIVNTGAAGYLTKFNVRGIPVYRYNPVETVISDQRSIWDYGQYILEFTRQYGQSTDDIQPFIFRMIMRDRKPRTIFSNPKFNGYDSVDHLAGFLALDIGDQIRLSSTKPESDALYYIQGCSFEIQARSEAITFNYVTTETLAGVIVGVTEIAIENTSTSGSGVNFGVLPDIADLSQMTICARIYKTDLDDGIINRWDEPGAGSSFLIARSGSNFAIDYRLFGTGGTQGAWRTGFTLNASTWYNIVVTFDRTSSTNDPSFYSNGSSIASSEILTPTLPYLSEANYNFVVSTGFATPLFGYAGFGGKLENIAIYNRILTAAEITTIHNGGTRLPFASYPQTGLKFFFGGMDSDSYTSKLDSTLGSLDTVYDLVNGFTGQPINSPTLRAVG